MADQILPDGDILYSESKSSSVTCISHEVEQGVSPRQIIDLHLVFIGHQISLDVDNINLANLSCVVKRPHIEGIKWDILGSFHF